MSKHGDEAVARKVNTILITCSLDNQAHHVTDNSLKAGQGTGYYQALCGHLVAAAALATPLGRPCTACIAALGVRLRTPTVPPVRRSWHRGSRWLLRILYRQRNAGMSVGR
jgi:hypothetical protein